MKKLILSFFYLAILAPLFAAEAPKTYRVNIKNFKEEDMFIKEVVIANDRLYFFSQETNMLYCYGATDKKELWRIFLPSLPHRKQYNSLYADNLGRCIIVAPQPKGTNLIELNNFGKLAAEHKFPEINPRTGKFLLFNGKIMFNGKEVGELKTPLVFLKEVRNKIAEATLKFGKTKEISKQEFQVPATVEGEGVEKIAFTFTLKFPEPTILVKITPIRIDNYSRAYLHVITMRDYREDEAAGGDAENFKSTVMLVDLKGNILFAMDPMKAISSMVTTDDEGKVCEVFKVKDPDKKTGFMYKVYYWYVKYMPK